MTDARAPVVVVGLDCMTGLQTARIFAAHGIPVTGLVADPRHFACRTRTATIVPYGDDGIVATLLRLPIVAGAMRHAGRVDVRPVLVPCTDDAVARLSRERDRLSAFHLALPSPQVVAGLMDKSTFATAAESAGLPLPATRLVGSPGDAHDAAAALTFPVVVKPRWKTAEWEAEAPAKAIVVAQPDELVELAARALGWTDTLVVQEWVVGGDETLYSCNCYYDRSGRPLATFVARKLRQWPPHVGTSCLGEEVRADDVLEAALRLFDSVGYHGLGYLEMKRDQRDGHVVAIEANIGRPTGRSAIAEAGGVPLLWTMYSDLVGLPIPDDRVQRYTGAKWWDVRRDLQSAVSYWRSGELTVAQYLASVRGPKSHAVWSMRDPLPFVADLAATARKAVRRRRVVPSAA